MTASSRATDQSRAPGEGAHAQRVGVAPEHPRRVHDVLDACRRPSPRPARSPATSCPSPARARRACPPWRNIAVSKLVRVRRLGSMNTIASTLRSSPPVISPRFTRAASASSAVDLGGCPVLQREEVALRHASTSFSPARSRSASSPENESGGQQAEHPRVRGRAGEDPAREQRALHLGGRPRQVQAQKEPASAHPSAHRAPGPRGIDGRRPGSRCPPTPRARSRRVLASAAAQGTGPPPNVLPRSPMRDGAR